MNARYSLHSARALASTLALAAGLVATTAQARTVYESRTTRPHYEAGGNIADVQIQVDGESAPLYFRPGVPADRHYFQAFKGRNYSVVIRNTTGQRVGVLIAVDGLNVVDGSKTRNRHDEPMYVLDPWETATIRGWRTSLDEVRRFVFVDEERSYAERTGQANGDMGWIRVTTFRDRDAQWGWGNWGRTRAGYRDSGPSGPTADRQELSPPPSAASPAPQKEGAQSYRGDAKSYDGPAAESNPGTGWGERRRDHVNEVEFRAVREAADQIVLRYEYSNGLRALGIYPRTSRTWDRERGELGFAQPPKW
jgi:hypothetical protein